MLVTETTGIKLLPKIIVLNPKDGSRCERRAVCLLRFARRQSCHRSQPDHQCHRRYANRQFLHIKFSLPPLQSGPFFLFHY